MPTNSFPCPFCRRVFKSAGPFDKHLRTAHSEQANRLYRPSIGLSQLQKSPDEENTDFEPDLQVLQLLHNSSYAGTFEGTRDSDCESEFDELPKTSGGASWVEDFDGAGQSFGEILEGLSSTAYSAKLLATPFHPFRNAIEFKLAKFFLQSGTSQRSIDSFLKGSLAPTGVKFGSAYSFRALLDSMETTLGPESWSCGEISMAGKKVPFYYRKPMDCIRYLLQQKAYSTALVYKPQHCYENGERIYGELHTADWWWETQQTLPPGSTLIPVICASDTTHLTNFSGDKKAWPIYITIGNIKSTVRNKPTAMALLLLAMLPVPPKLKESSRRDTLSAENNAMVQQVLAEVLGDLRKPGEEGTLLRCSDEKKRFCFPVLCAWIADHMEHVLLHNIKTNACPTCEVPPEALGEPPQETVYPTRNHKNYQLLAQQHQETGEFAPIEELAEKGITALFSAFWTLPRVDPAELAKPDLLHTVYLGILKHLMEWIQDFLKKHNRLEYFDLAWSTMGPYPGFTVPKKAYREVSQWQGKEMRNLGRIVLPAFAAAIRTPSDAERAPFRTASRCVTAIVDFHLMAQYPTHTESTLDYMQSFLDVFHEEKEIFREFRVGKRGKKQANGVVSTIASRQAIQARKMAKKGKTATQRRKAALQDREELVSARVEEASKRAHFNFIKMHLLQHFRSHVQRYGSVLIFSTDVSELAHKTQIKESYRRSNRNNAVLQILDNYTRVHTLSMRVLNVAAALKGAPEALQKAREDPEMDIFTACMVQRSAESEAVESTVEPRPKRQLRGLVGASRDLSDLAEALGIPGLGQSILDYAKSEGLTSIVESISRGCESIVAEHFNMLEVAVPVFQDPDSYTLHNLRCTQERLFRGCNPRNDWVWVEVGEGFGATGDLRGRLPGRLRGLIKLRDPGNVFMSHRVAVVELLWPVNNGISDPYDTLVRVRKREYKNPAKAFITVNISSLLGMAHLVEYGEGKWLVNNRIDLKTWNDIYAC